MCAYIYIDEYALKCIYRGAPLPRIDSRASATVTQNDTRAGRLTFAHNISLEISHRKMRAPKARALFFMYLKINVLTHYVFLSNLQSH